MESGHGCVGQSKNFNIELREVIFGCCVTNTYDDDTMSPDVDILSCLVRCVKMTAKFDFSISENYAYVDSYDKVQRIIRDHKLDTTTKYALFKAPRDFGRKGKAIQRSLYIFS